MGAVSVELKNGRIYIFEGNYRPGYILVENNKIYVERLDYKACGRKPEKYNLNMIDKIIQDHEIYRVVEYATVRDNPFISDEYLKNIIIETRKILDNDKDLIELVERKIIVDYRVDIESVDSGRWKKVFVLIKFSNKCEILEELWFHPYVEYSNSYDIEKLKCGKKFKPTIGNKSLIELQKKYDEEIMNKIYSVLSIIVYVFLKYGVGYKGK